MHDKDQPPKNIPVANIGISGIEPESLSIDRPAGSSVGRAEDCSGSPEVILRSPVQIWFGGQDFLPIASITS